MMAAIAAAGRGAETVLLEKNEKTGRKLCITGKGRCNVTNASEPDAMAEKFFTGAKFMYGPLNAFSSADLIEFFASNGLKMKRERGGRVFPETDSAYDVRDALEARMKACGVRVRSNARAVSVETEGGGVSGVKTEHSFYEAGAAVIATGGLSYPSTGSTGDGLDMARSLGHRTADTYPSLVPLIANEPWIAELEGLSLKNVKVTAACRGKTLFSEMGEMLFTRSGISGPLALEASGRLTDKFDKKPAVSIDLKPALSAETLDARLLRDFAANMNKNFANSLDGLLPKRLIGIIVRLSGVDPEKKVNCVTKAERLRLGGLLKGLTITPVGTAGYQEAIVTMGGVETKEINPATMMSKLVGGLFFAGEVIDVDAATGGYNLQAAFSTGFVAGCSAAKRVGCV